MAKVQLKNHPFDCLVKQFVLASSAPIYLAPQVE
jgi:hypothetical protein